MVKNCRSQLDCQCTQLKVQGMRARSVGCRASGLTSELGLPVHVVLVPPLLVPPLLVPPLLVPPLLVSPFIFRRWFRWCNVNRIAFGYISQWNALGRFVFARCGGYRKAQLSCVVLSYKSLLVQMLAICGIYSRKTIGCKHKCCAQ